MAWSPISCPTCRRACYASTAALLDHQRDACHCFCKLCYQRFPTIKDYRMHTNVPHTCSCGFCGLRFQSTDELKTHQREKKHGFCAPCYQYFSSQDLLRTHEKSPNHISHFYCCDCGREFTDQQALEQHLKDKVHKIPKSKAAPAGPQSPARTHHCECGRKFAGKSALAQHILAKGCIEPLTTCDKCQKQFKSAQALQQHQSSVKHKPLSSLRCVANEKCKGRFSSPSALLHHLESGGCCSGLTREKLNDLVLANDTRRQITLGEDENPPKEAGCDDGKLSFLKQGLLSTSPWDPIVKDVSPSWLRARPVASEWTSSSEETFITPSSSSESLVLVSRPNTVSSADPGLPMVFGGTTVMGNASHASSFSGVMVPTPSASDTAIDDHDHHGMRAASTFGSFGSFSATNNLSTSAGQSRLPRAGLRCSLCPTSRKVFHSVTAVENHMASPVHAPRIFHCPINIFPTSGGKGARTAMTTFSTLSGLTQHIESGACHGGDATLRAAIAMVESRLRDLGFGNVRLLKEGTGTKVGS